MSTLVNKNLTEVFVIGDNGSGEAGLGHTHTIQQLTQIKTNKLLSKIYPSFNYIIYTDDELNNILGAGYNAHGQLGINKKSKIIKTLTPIRF